MLYSRSNSEILEELGGYVCGHVNAKKALINLLNRSLVRHHQKWILGFEKDYLIQTHKCLLIGQSGTGKTHLIESLQQIIDFPLVRVDATKLNTTGASGGIKSSDLEKMIVDKAMEYCDKKRSYFPSVEGTIDKVVVFVDEIDKLGKSFDSSGNWNAHVQANFLTMFDNKESFAGVSFIFAGAFSDITKETEEKHSLGFTTQTANVDSNKEDIDARVVKCGLIPELVGRLTNIVELDKFTLKDYESILMNVLLPKKRIELAYFGLYNSDLTAEEAVEFSKKAKASGQGIRSLQRQLDTHFSNDEFDHEDFYITKLIEGESQDVS